MLHDQENLSMDDLHFDEIDSDLAELAAENVLSSGTYTAIADGHKAFVLEDRQMASISYQLLSEEGRKLRKVRVKVSWQKAYQNGRLDKPFRMYGKLVKALGAESGSPLEVLPLANEVPVKVVVNEAYLAEEGDVHEMHEDRNATNDGKVWAILPAADGSNDDDVSSARMFYLGKGLEPIYLVQNIFEEK